MSFTLALVINLVAMLALIAGLAFVMSRATLLTPHRGAEDDGGTLGQSRDDAPGPGAHRRRRRRRRHSMGGSRSRPPVGV